MRIKAGTLTAYALSDAGLLEDVTTTGGSSIKAAEAVRAEGADVVGVVTVVDRQEGAGEAFAAAGLTLTPILTLDDFK
jgi:orotate phosphoribosyltransferase